MQTARKKTRSTIPDDVIFDVAVDVVTRRCDASDVTALTPSETTVYWVGLAYGTIGNGGFRGWYGTHAEMKPVVQAFTRIGLPVAAEACQASLAFFAGRKPPADGRKRWKEIVSREAEADVLWSPLLAKLFKQWKKIPSSVADYVRTQIHDVRDVNDQIEIERVLRRISSADRDNWKRLRGARRTVAAVNRFIQREHLLMLFSHSSSLSMAVDMAMALKKIGLSEPSDLLMTACVAVSEKGGLKDEKSGLDLESASKDCVNVLRYLNDELQPAKVQATKRLAELLRSGKLAVK